MRTLFSLTIHPNKHFNPIYLVFEFVFRPGVTHALYGIFIYRGARFTRVWTTSYEFRTNCRGANFAAKPIV